MSDHTKSPIPPPINDPAFHPRNPKPNSAITPTSIATEVGNTKELPAIASRARGKPSCMAAVADPNPKIVLQPQSWSILVPV